MSEHEADHQAADLEATHYSKGERAILAELRHLDRKVGRLVATVEDLTNAFNSMKADAEAKAAEVKAEFEKLEAEVAAGGGNIEPSSLDALKASIDAFDEAIKAAAVPTS